MEYMVNLGRISQRAADILVNGYSDALLVRVYVYGGLGDYVEVTVFE